MARLFLTDDRHEVLERRRHAASGADLVLIRPLYCAAMHREGYVVGWAGLKDLASDCVAWIKPFDSLEAARHDFETVLSEGPPGRRTRPADRQRERLYRWERACIGPRFADEEILSLEDCQYFVDEVWQETGRRRPPPRVKDGRGRRRAGAARGFVTMPTWTRRRWQLLHEVSHVLTDDRHGPLFVRTYLQLLERFLGVSQARAEAELAEMGVRAAEPGKSVLPMRDAPTASRRLQTPRREPRFGEMTP